MLLRSTLYFPSSTLWPLRACERAFSKDQIRPSANAARLASILQAGQCISAACSNLSTGHCLLSLAPIVRAVQESSVDFITQVKPILVKNCAGCHGAKKQQVGLRADHGTCQDPDY